VNIKKSLQTLKSDLGRKEATLKLIRNHYPHLADFTEEDILAYFHLSTINELSEHMQDFIKTSTDDDIHHNALCTCKDSKGEFKDIYETQELAQQKADLLMTHQVLKLKVYPCPSGYGWHLTKR
jgi:hypothetical protein